MIVQLCSAHYECLTFQHPQSQRGSVTLREVSQIEGPRTRLYVEPAPQKSSIRLFLLVFSYTHLVTSTET